MTVSSQLKGEQLATIGKLVSDHPQLRGVVGIKSVVRWIRHGLRLADGTTLRLEAAKIGSRFATSAEAVTRFIDRLNTTPAPAANPAVRSPVKRARAAAAAGKKLAAAGA